VPDPDLKPPISELEELNMAQLPEGNGTTLKLGDVVRFRVSLKTGNVWKAKNRPKGSGFLTGMVVYLGPSLPEGEIDYEESRWIDSLIHADVQTLVNSIEPTPRFRGSGETGEYHALVSVLTHSDTGVTPPPVYYHMSVPRLIFVKEGNRAI
jgi:hypothetical protein